MPKAVVNFNVMVSSVSLINSFYLGINYAVRWFFSNLKPSNFFHLFSAHLVKFKHFVPISVFQGSHFEADNLIYFPSLTYFEKNSVFRNAEGRLQLVRIAVSPVSDKIKNDWRIVKALGDYMNVIVNNDDFSSKVLLNKVEDVVVTKKIFFDNNALLMIKPVKINFSNFVSFNDPYLVDSLTRNSVTMALVSVVLNNKLNNFI
jgi:NADH dehydrogenase/NADH:ubiquinone oxidoreductase subunit G